MPLFENGALVVDIFSAPVQTLIVNTTNKAAQFHASKVSTIHFFLTLLDQIDERQLYALQEGLRPGVQFGHVLELVKVYQESAPRGTSSPTFNGLQNEFTRLAQDVLDMVYENLLDTPSDNADLREGFEKAWLWIAACSYPDAEMTQWLDEVLDFEAIRTAFSKLAQKPKPLPALYDESSDELLLLEYFSEDTITILQRAAESAGQMGYNKIMTAHVVTALIAFPDGVGERLIRHQAKGDVGPAKVIEEINRNISLGFHGKPKTFDLSRASFSIPLQRALEAAFRKAALHDSEVIDEPSLAYGILAEEQKGRVAEIFKLPSVSMDIGRMLPQIDRYIQEMQTDDGSQQIAPFLLPKSVAKSEDLTYLAQTERLPVTVNIDTLYHPKDKQPIIEQIKRGLHKHGNNHILITGPAGVGKTALMRELARQIAKGEIPFLNRKKLVWVNCAEISPEESRAKLEEIILAVKGRNDVLVCLDNFEKIVKFAGQREGNNLTPLKTALGNQSIHLIGIMEERHFNELLASDHLFLKMFTCVEIEEPDTKSARAIVMAVVPTLEQAYKLGIEEAAISKAVILSRDFILSEHLPAKAIEVLKEACELASYEHQMEQAKAGKDSEDAPATRPTVTPDKVIKTIAERTGVPESTLRGTGEAVDFEDVLSKSVVGQLHAVETSARELKLIKGGAKDPVKPASIMLFAGLTGTGKTELAKAIAQVYSASKKLTVYTMGNFNESHSVSGIVGVPPGYVGYEEGGRLVNDLNTDPYSVVLLDEVEKAHPDIWKPFLNLFDEGWMVDQRNVKAYGNRAIFILTSNAGADTIARMLAASESMENIIKAVKKELLDIEHPTARQRCFTPEFLARITQIIIFNPLSLEALDAIARLRINRLKQSWSEKRGKQLEVAEALIAHIANLGNQRNQESNNREGGRIIQKLIAELIETPLQDKVAADPAAYQRANIVRVEWMPPKPFVTFEETAALTPEEATQRAGERIQSLIDELRSAADSPIKARLERAELMLKEWDDNISAWAAEQIQAVDQTEREALWTILAEVRTVVEQEEQTLTNQLNKSLKTLIRALGDAHPVKSYYEQETIQTDDQ